MGQRGSCWDLCQRELPMLSSKRFIVSGLTLKPLIHLEFIFVYSVRDCSNFILLSVAIQFSQHHFFFEEAPLFILKRLCFLHCIFLPPLSMIRCPYVRGFISGLSFLFHCSLFLFLCHYHIILMTSFVI